MLIAKIYGVFLLIIGIGFYYKSRSKTQPEKELRISKTLFPLESPKDYNEWMQDIILERQILSVKNESDSEVDSNLENNLIRANILKLINK